MEARVVGRRAPGSSNSILHVFAEQIVIAEDENDRHMARYDFAYQFDPDGHSVGYISGENTDISVRNTRQQTTVRPRGSDADMKVGERPYFH
jgi:hypothetical protein